MVNGLENIKSIIAVASGKGGVGKSTVAFNLAVAMSFKGLRVGLLDADIYGPSIPTMSGEKKSKPETRDGKIIPHVAHGIKMMSIGFLMDDASPLIWRGAMVHKAVVQMLSGVDWGDLDVLIVDMPPGTGDAHLTLVQKARPKGAVIVSTPQDLALSDAKKAIGMFKRTGVEIFGIIENMSGFQCPNCDHVSYPFSQGGAEKYAIEAGCDFLGALPLDINVRQDGDDGTPIVLSKPKSAPSKAILLAVDKIKERL